MAAIIRREMHYESVEVIDSEPLSQATNDLEKAFRGQGDIYLRYLAAKIIRLPDLQTPRGHPGRNILSNHDTGGPELQRAAANRNH